MVLHAPAAIPLVCTFGLAAVLAVIGRICFRAVSRIWGPDDVIIIFALLVALALDSLLCTEYNALENNTIWEGEVHEKLYYSANICAILSPCLTKISILLFYRRLISGTSRSIERVLIGSMAMVVMYTIVFICVYAFSCRPVQFYWLYVDPIYVEGVDYTCYNDGYGNVGGSLMSAITDVWVITLPVFFLKNLAIRREKKLSLYILFSLGAFTSAAGVIRAGLLIADAVYSSYPDVPNWIIVELDRQSIYWFIIEANGGIVCACMPALKPLFGRIKAFESSFSLPIKTPSAPSSSSSAWRSRLITRSITTVELGDIGERRKEQVMDDSTSNESQTAMTHYNMSKMPRTDIESAERVNDDAASIVSHKDGVPDALQG